MEKRIAKKVLSAAIALFFVLQLLPFGTVAAADSEGISVESAQSSESEATVGLFASGGASGVLSDVTNTEYLLIHGTTGTHPTGIIIKNGATTLSPDASGNYSNVPTGATLELNLGFDLTDGDGGSVIYDYDGTESFTFQLPEGITFNTTSGTVPSSGSPTIANWTIDSNDVLKVQFTSAIAGQKNIWGYVKMTGTFDSMASGGTDTKIQLGSQTITITRNPADPLPPVGEINLGKNGAYDPSTNQIAWTVTVTPSSADQDISGYKIIDTYNNQTYVTDSFKVSPSYDSASLNHSAPTLTYVFPAGTKGTQVITYQTSPTGVFDSTTQFKNQAELRTPADAHVKSAEKTITLGTIIKKEGTNIQPDGQGIIDWTVTVTLPKASDGKSYYLPNAKITDVMDSKLSLITADAAHPIKISFDGGATYSAVSGGSEAGEYNVGGVNTLTYNFPATNPYTGTTTVFKYSTKVTNWNADMMNNDPITFTNNARFEWKTNPGGLGGGSAVSIGAATVTKTAGGGGLVLKSLASGWASQSAYDRTSEKSGDYIKWKIVVNGNKVALTNAFIKDTVQPGHDLIISSEHPLTVTKNTGTAFSENFKALSAAGNLTAASTASFTYTFPASITDTYTIEYYTQLNDTGRDAMYRGTNQASANKAFKNDVVLSYNGTTANSSATKTYTLEMLNKSVATGYNIGDHTVKWQLVVNRNMLLMTGSSVTDTVEDGMVIDYGKPISIKVNNGSEVTLSTTEYSESGSPLNGAKYAVSNSDKTLTITLPPSTSSQFTITYWTKVTDATLQSTSLWTAKSKTFGNTANLEILGKTDITTTSTVTAKNPVITKTHDYDANNPYEIINWTAVVNPAQIALTNGAVTDALNSNLELVDGSVKLYSTNIDANGQPTGAQTAVTLTKGGTANGTNAAYTYFGNTLTVSLPTTTSKAYVLKFQTTIVDDKIIASFTNTISLSSDSTGGTDTSSQVTVHEVTAIGGMYSNKIIVQKTDGNGKNLAGAKFQLLNKNGNPVKRMDGGSLKDIIVQTGGDGKAEFPNLPGWVFQVKEIDPPPGYLIVKTDKMSVNNGVAISGDVTVDATDTLGETDVVIYKKGALGIALGGGNFALTGKDYKGDNVNIPGNNVGGTVTFSKVPIGTGQYTIKEVAAPTGHIVSAEEIKVTVGYNGDKTAVQLTYPSDITIENAPTPTSTQVSFTKVSSKDGTKPLPGGSFTLSGTAYDSTPVNKVVVADANGVVNFTDITIGTYYIYEITSPAGYLMPNTSPATTPVLDVAVAYNSGKTGLVVTFTKHGGGAAETNGSGNTIFKNTPAVGDITFQKNSSSNPSAKINGGNFKISGTTIADTAYEAYASAVNGVVTFTDVPVVKVGTSYTISEVTAPPAYLPTTVQLTAKVEYTDITKTAIIVTNPATGLKNDPAPFVANTEVSVLKTDKDGKSLAGASFTLYNSSGNSIATAVSGNDGIALFTNLPINSSYTIKETSAPTGYELGTQIISFTLTNDKPLSFTVVNEKKAEKTGSIKILKTDAGGTVLGGAEFTLYDSSDKAIHTVVTKSDGTAEFSNVPEGDYTVSETSAPLGYVAAAGSTSVKITNGSIQSLTFINQKAAVSVTGKLQIIKVDKNYHPLSGAKFTLYDKDGNVIAMKVSGSDGMTVFDGLAPGNYSVQETEAPKGYKLLSDPLKFQIGSSASSLSYTLKNTAVDDDSDVAGWSENNPDGGTLPKTGGIPGTFYMLLAGLSLLLFGLIIAKPKMRRGKHLAKNRK